MRTTCALLLALALLAPSAAGHSIRRTHIVDTDENFEFVLIRDSDGDYYAELERDGVRYRTTDPSVLAQLERALEDATSQEHSRLGRQHSELGREHSALGREHSRLGREHSRLARDGDSAAAERRRREIEAEQRDLEAKQRKLEDRQRALEAEQRRLEARQRAAEKARQRSVAEIFERAVREGKAKRR